MYVDKVVKRPEDPFPRVCESVTYGKSRNVVNDYNIVRFRGHIFFLGGGGSYHAFLKMHKYV